ncbi:TetR/AcrR family transcriptional regulator [Streptomyces sp. NPDC053048]|uniref:TetR/AcrR family transcriptional regulator n=1 Tax=Streptomyces sp. NPDC053048 TaxID=3365694 RepID=UPI0037CD9FDC
MGHREDLLEGARRCLLEKGWVGTTARDIVAASGANLASIGYHYGSKNALMMEAFLQLTEDWGQEVERSLATGIRPGAPRDERIAAVLDAVVEGFSENRPFWQAQLEVMGQLDRHPELKERFAQAMPAGREGLVAMFEGVADTDVPEEASRTSGSVYYSLFIGLWVQWLIDPALVPSGAEVVAGLRRVVDGTVLAPAPAPSAK